MSNRRIPSNNVKCVKPLQPYSYLSGKLKDKKDYKRYYKWLNNVNLNENICTSLSALSKDSENKDDMKNIMIDLLSDIYEDIREIRKTIFYKYMTIKHLKNKLIYMEEIDKYPEDSDQYKEMTKIIDNIIFHFTCIDRYVEELKERIDNYNDLIDIYNSRFKEQI